LALILATFGGAAPGAEPAKLKLSFASTFPSGMPLIGAGAPRIAEKIARATGGEVVLEFHEPGKLVPATRTMYAVSEGKVDAGWAGAGWFASVDSAFNMFSTVPFGPGIGEYMAWMYHGGGLEAARAMFAERNLHNIPCAIIPPEASGWFQKEIRSIADLKGLRMRFFGLGAKVMQKYGVVTTMQAPGDILAALKSGELDATEFSLPQMDQKLGFHQVAKYYYFPGWHQQATFFDLYINKKRWEALADRHKAVIELACGDMVRASIAEGEAMQWKAMREMQAAGVQIRRWPNEMIAALESAWNEVAAEEAQRNPNFQRLYESYLAFRRDYAIWNEHAYLR
jgi:TRAP-type mannitol/chloroaromatic compound transport system substrate-binding protein